MAATFIHTCYRVLDPARGEDFYVNKLGSLFKRVESPELQICALLTEGGGERSENWQEFRDWVQACRYLRSGNSRPCACPHALPAGAGYEDPVAGDSEVLDTLT